MTINNLKTKFNNQAQIHERLKIKQRIEKIQSINFPKAFENKVLSKMEFNTFSSLAPIENDGLSSQMAATFMVPKLSKTRPKLKYAKEDLPIELVI